MQRHIIAGFGVVAAVALAAAPAAAKPAEPPTRPFSGSVTTHDFMDDSTQGCTLDGAMWSYGGEGPGTFSQLGKVWFEIEHCSKMTGEITGAFGGGTITITAANGDQLYLVHEGTFELAEFGPAGPQKSYVNLSWTVVGGTGRFIDATGSGTAAPIGDLVAMTTSSSDFRGTITYDASNASVK